jgi:hypothetical protein
MHFENSMIDALCDRGHTPYRQIGHRAVSYVRIAAAFRPESEMRRLTDTAELAVSINEYAPGAPGLP